MLIKEMSQAITEVESDEVITMSIHSNRPGSVVLQSEWLRLATGRAIAASGCLPVDANITYHLDYVNGVFFFELGDKYSLVEAVAKIIDFVFARKGRFVHDQVVVLAIKDISELDGQACLRRAQALSIDHEIELTTKVVRAMRPILQSIRSRANEHAQQMDKLDDITDPSERTQCYETLQRRYNAEIGRLRQRSIDTTMMKSRVRFLKHKRRTYARH